MAALGIAARVLLVGVGSPSVDDPASAVMAVVRIVAGVLALYLLGATVLSLVAALTRSRPLAGLADLVSAPVVRRLVAAGIGGGLLLSPVAASADVVAPAPVEAPVLRRLPEAVPVDPAPVAPVTVPVPVPPPPANEVTVVPGDHLWGIAEKTLASRLGRAPSDGEIAPFWVAIIEKNRSRLANPDDPSLIFAGQTFFLP